MSYKIKNTALDPSKRFLHRTAPKLQMEPVIGGRRLRLKSSLVISDELFEHNKANLELWRKWGVVDWETSGEAKQPEVKVEGDVAPPLVVNSIPPEDPIPPTQPTEVPTSVENPPPPTPETPPAETSSEDTRPQPKSPFKGKKH